MFTYHQHDKGGTAPFEYLPGTVGEAFAVGVALIMSAAGALTKCAGAVAPGYICMGPVGADGLLPCTRVSAAAIYDVPLSADGAGLKLGNKLTIGVDGMTVTATTASGVAELVRMDGTAVGNLVGVRMSV